MLVPKDSVGANGVCPNGILRIQLTTYMMPALVQVMACRLLGAKPLPEPMLTHFTGAYIRHEGVMS